MRFSLRIVAVCLFMVLAAKPALPAAEPFADLTVWMGELGQREDVQTHAEYARECFEFYHHAITETYARHGQRNELWDARMEPVFEAAARVLAGLEHDLSTDEFKETMQEAYDLGCRDRMFFFAAGVIFRSVKDWKRGRRAYSATARAYEDWEAYPPSLRAALCRRMLYYAAGEHPEIDISKFIRWLVRDLEAHYACWREGDYSSPRQFVRHLHAGVDFSDSRCRKLFQQGIGRFLDRIDDGWIREAVRGSAEIRRAWMSRGDGWANTVTEEGWEGYRKHLAKARTALTRAWEIDPTQAGPADEMITVCMGQSASLEEHVLWFKRSVEAEIDNPEPYSNLSWALRPRWGGSHEQMLALAEAAAATERYDSLAPYQYLLVLKSIYNDLTDKGKHPERADALFERPEVWETVDRILSNMLVEPVHQEKRKWYGSTLHAFAWRCGKLQRARELLVENKRTTMLPFHEFFKVDFREASREIHGGHAPKPDTKKKETPSKPSRKRPDVF